MVMEPKVRTRALAAAIVAGALLVGVAGGVPLHGTPPPMEARELVFHTSDGEQLVAWLAGRAPLDTARPLVMEFTPYATAWNETNPLFGDEFNHLWVHVRGTGGSSGRWDLFGPTEQRDVRELVEWACAQPWSNGRVGIFGNSASSIVAYNALRHHIPCLETAVLWTGTSSLYRDVSYIGGVPSLAVPLGFAGLVAAPYAGTLPSRLGARPGTVPESTLGFADVAQAFFDHPTEDEFWRERAFSEPVDPYSVPLLLVSGSYDIEVRAPFEAFMATRRLGSQLRLLGGHDGGPGEPYTDRVYATASRWFAHHLLDVENGIDSEPAVQLVVPVGGHEALNQERYVEVHGPKWPLPVTKWQQLFLHDESSGTASSINDGTLAGRPSDSAPASYPYVPSNLLATDPHVSAMVSALSGTAADHTHLRDVRSAEAIALTYTTPPLEGDVDVVGPASLTLHASSTATETDYVAVLADVLPDGAARAVGAARLRSTFPHLDGARSLVDKRTGDAVRPWNLLSSKAEVPPGAVVEYTLEFWPLLNRFEAGHRLRLYIVGAPIGSTQPSLEPAINTVFQDTLRPSRLTLPVLDGASIPTG